MREKSHEDDKLRCGESELHFHCLQAPILTPSSVVDDKTPLPPRDENATEEQDEALFNDDPWVEPPFRADFATNVHIGKNVFINYNCSIVDTCIVSIGSRTLFGPNVSLYSGGHVLDPGLRNGAQGPEFGKPITIGEDCWLGGNVTVLPGVTIGRGSTVGAGSVVTKVYQADHDSSRLEALVESLTSSRTYRSTAL
jgi:acetyltransferase-like isoleucine patch superfamily enzyme